MNTKLHTVNGAVQGCWYYLSTGTTVYVALRNHQRLHKTWGLWLIPNKILEDLAQEGGYVVVHVPRGKTKSDFYMDRASTILNSGMSVKKRIDTSRHTGIPAMKFAINPSFDSGKISRAVKVR